MKIEPGCVSIDQTDMNNEETMSHLSELMNAQQDMWIQEIQEIAEQYNISDGWASDIWYLRTRSRWTQEKESEMIKQAQNGEDRMSFEEI